MQQFIDRHFYNLFILTYILGILLYDIIGFKWSDEICALILLFGYIYILFKDNEWRMNKVFLLVIGIFLFYLIYSFQIHSNSAKAIVMDFIIQAKPYLVFYCIYQLKPEISIKQQKLLNAFSLLVWFVFLIPIGLIGIVSMNTLILIIGHPTSFASAVIITSLIYLYTSEDTLKNKLIFIIMLSLGLISGRSKFYGFFIMASAIVLYFNHPDKVKINFKNIALVSLMLLLVFIAVKDKIQFYFIDGITGEDDTEYLARLALYVTSFSIFNDYFPFGSGFATFGTYASGVYYSPLYSEYGIDHVWGLSKSYTSFVADTYYPSLAQFGIVGLALFGVFWIYILKKTVSFAKKQKMRDFAIILCIITFILIESVADSTFTGNRGLMVMMLLGYIMANLSIQQSKG